MKTTTLFAAGALFLLFASSCGGSKGKQHEAYVDKYGDSVRIADSIAENAPPIDIHFDGALDKANDGKRVSIEGYMALPSTSYISDDNVQLGFFERDNQFEGAFLFIVNVSVGKAGEKNSMVKIPLKYKPEDVKITGNNSEAITIGDHVKLTGKLRVSDTYASIDCEKIEKLDPVKVDYSKLGAIEVTPENINKPEHEGHLVYADGFIDMPVKTMGGDYTFVYLELKGNHDNRLTIDIAYGDEPARLEDLPANYTDKDVKIHDDNGNLISLKKQVRVYGIWDKQRIKVESIQNL